MLWRGVLDAENNQQVVVFIRELEDKKLLPEHKLKTKSDG